MVARRSADSWEESAGVAAQALSLQARAAPLALADAEVWEQALQALKARNYWVVGFDAAAVAHQGGADPRHGRDLCRDRHILVAADLDPDGQRRGPVGLGRRSRLAWPSHDPEPSR